MGSATAAVMQSASTQTTATFIELDTATRDNITKRLVSDKDGKYPTDTHTQPRADTKKGNFSH